MSRGKCKTAAICRYILTKTGIYSKILPIIERYRFICGASKMDDLKLQIKELIIKALELEDIKPENIQDAEPIFGAGLGLDSIDALELGVAIKKKFGVKFSAETEDNKKHFASVDALAAYIGSAMTGAVHD
jgi:acyl carrier protein